MRKTKKIITIALAIITINMTITNSSSAKTIKNVLTETVEVINKFQSNTSSSDIEEISVRCAKLINTINQLNTESFCSLNSILSSNEDAEKKLLQINSNPKLKEVYASMIEINEFGQSHKELGISFQNQETKTTFINLLKPKVSFLDDTNAPSKLDCRAYVAAHNACSFGFASCCAVAFMAGPEAWGPGLAICTINLMYCCNNNDWANPECAAAYQWLPLPNIPNSIKANKKDICK